MKSYTGTRAAGNVVEVFVHDGGRKISNELDPRLDLVDHKSNGKFNWGYDGAAPAQLALALCADVLKNDKRAVAIHKAFMARYVVRWSQGQFEIVADTLVSVIKDLELGT